MRIIRAVFLAVFFSFGIFACTISGTVEDASGRPLAGGVVSIYNETTLHQIAVGVGANAPEIGKFKSPQLPCPAKYTVTADRPDSVHYAKKSVQLSSDTTFDVVLYPLPARPWYWKFREPEIAFLLTLIFFISLILFRWNNIALLDQNQLWAEVAATTTRLLIDAPDPKSPRVVILEAELLAALKPFVKISSRGADKDGAQTIDLLKSILNQKPTAVDLLFWTRGQEIAAWTRVREVQRLMIYLLPDKSSERVRARLQVAEQTLKADASPTAMALCRLVQEALAIDPLDANEDRLRELLLEVTSYINNTREETFSAVTIWQSKAAWLAITACVFIVATVTARGGGFLFLAGGVGGYMSRLARALQASDTPTDYGASWNTLFLSPLLGSLAGFFGVLLLEGLGSGGVLSEKVLTGAGSELALPAMAFLFGFSERFFNSVVNALDKQPAEGGAGAKPVPPAGPAATLNVVATGVRDVQPMPVAPGGQITVTGRGLNSDRVAGVQLAAQDKSLVTLTQVVQETEQIRFTLPAALAEGSYTLTLMVKDAPFIAKTVRVQLPPVITGITPADPKPAGSIVTITGTGLGDGVTVQLLDSTSTPVKLPDLRQAATQIQFTAPAAGTYKLVLRSGTGQPVEAPLVFV